MPDAPVLQSVAPYAAAASRDHSSTSLRAAWYVVVLRRWTVISVVGGMLLACLIYCLVAPNEYEAKARIALRTAPATALTLDGADPGITSAGANNQPQLETVANVFRSDQLAWKAIVDGKLYQSPAFMGWFSRPPSGFNPQAPSAAEQGWLLERFSNRLHVRTLPRTLVIEVRFRSLDAALSAKVVNALVQDYGRQESEARVAATAQSIGWLQKQLAELKLKSEADDRRLAEFQRQHGILISPQTLTNGQPGDTQHTSALLEVDELGRQLVAASAERILREAEYRAAAEGDPELVLASDAALQSASGGISTAVFRQIHARHSELEQEQAQLSIEHGPNFPRVVEIRTQLADLDHQLAAEDTRLRERFRSGWQTAADREQLARRSLAERTGDAQKMSEAAAEYEAMRREADSSRALYLRIQEKVAEAGLTAGVSGSDIWVLDAARTPAKPVAPDLPVYMAITLFVGLWLAVGSALLLESLNPSVRGVSIALALILLSSTALHGQAPTPSTSGLPTGVARIPAGPDTRVAPNPKDAPAVWSASGVAAASGSSPMAAGMPSIVPMPIAQGDLLDISEFHTPEFHSSVRVSAAGTVKLPLVDEVRLGGMNETEAAKAIAAALVAQGMLMHPQVFVVVTSSSAQDISVLGEVSRPGVYAYALHHRLLDLISSASGLSAGAGAVVNIYHRNDPDTPHSVALDPGGAENRAVHNPELEPGDTIQVSRAGLVYVVGDVIRPGGFMVDPTQQVTVLEALSLAWGPSQNAAGQKALLIREQNGSRTVTTLNLKRMLRGQDPDQPIHDRDILFVPDSAIRNLWNRTMESVVQSAAGVSIYAGLVYSQRF